MSGNHRRTANDLPPFEKGHLIQLYPLDKIAQKDGQLENHELLCHSLEGQSQDRRRYKDILALDVDHLLDLRERANLPNRGVVEARSQ
jgi:hypothetical protein